MSPLRKLFFDYEGDPFHPVRPGSEACIDFPAEELSAKRLYNRLSGIVTFFLA